MKKPIAIIAGEPNSISSELIFKSWKLKKKYICRPIIIIGSVKLLNLQKKKLKYDIKIKEVNNNFNLNDLNSRKLPVYNIKYSQKKAFQKISSKSNKYIIRCFETAVNLIKYKKIIGIVNCPVSKETLFKKKHQGITEYLARKASVSGNETMLIFNKKLSVSPVTTHIQINQVTNKIKKSKIINNIKIINNFYKKHLKRKPNILVLGLNPHNFSSSEKSIEKQIIYPSIKAAKKLKINVVGPISPDTSFMYSQRSKFDVIIGMYHDQVLSPFKTLFEFDAVNITLGLPYIRISPDHGVAENIMGKNIANPKSLIESIKFFNLIK